MNEDSKECSTTVCIQWHASVIVAEKTLTKLAAAGGHELVRQGCFFLLGRCPSCSSFDVVVFYSQSSCQGFFEKEHTHANVFKT